MKRRWSVRGRMTGDELRDHQRRTAVGMLEVYEANRENARRLGIRLEDRAFAYRLKRIADEMLARSGQELTKAEVLEIRQRVQQRIRQRVQQRLTARP